MKKGLFVLIEIDKEFKAKTKVLSVDDSDTEVKMNFFYNSLGCRLIDIVAYNEEIDLIVDDEGLLVSKNPLLEIANSFHKEPLMLAGNVLIGKKVFVAGEGYETVGFENPDEIFQYLEKYKFEFRVIGMTA